MALNPGTRLGPYEIKTELGAGGLGEVYWARDTKLDRDVAIKARLDSFAARDRLLRPGQGAAGTSQGDGEGEAMTATITTHDQMEQALEQLSRLSSVKNTSPGVVLILCATVRRHVQLFPSLKGES
jgi:hypothetical protein